MGNEPDRKFYLKEFKAISHAISTYGDLNLLISHLTEGTTKTFEAKGCCIMLFDETENQLFTVSSYGISDEYLSKGPLLVNNNSCAFVRGEPLFVEDLSKDARIQYPDAAKKEGIVSMLSIPILFHEDSIGVIRIYHSEKKEYNEEDIDALKILAEHLGLVIEYNGLRNFLDKVQMAVESLPARMLKGMK
ncbi:MAG: GAF domain-containing protein [Deltaproteobacteria bacterium]|nr:GAF domain-containing protein [Deltaproteobacteria bacterium]